MAGCCICILTRHSVPPPLSSDNVSYSLLSGSEGLLELLEPSVQRLLATAATAPVVETQNGGGGLVVANVLVLLHGGAEQVAALEETGASRALESTLQVSALSLSLPPSLTEW